METQMEIPPLNNWRKHLPKMLNSFYIVNGVKSKFLDYELSEESHTIRLHLAARPYDYKFDEMPEILRHWKPVNHGDYVSYDHIAAEKEVLLVEKTHDSIVKEPPITPEESLKSLFLNYMQGRLTGSGEVNRKIDETIINLKNKENVDQNQINRAKAINDLLRTAIANKKLDLEILVEAKKIFNIGNENENPNK